MGTNFYLYETPPCLTCGHCADEPRHIGKSSGGWCFALHVYPEDGIATLDDWKRIWSGKTIKDEYGKLVTEEEMLNQITNRRSKPMTEQGLGSWYDSVAEWYSKNGAEPGPNNLARHRIGHYCVGHGEGTWDYIVGEFS